MTILRKFLADETGATAVEYGLIASLVAVAIIDGLVTVGSTLGTTFTKVVHNLR